MRCCKLVLKRSRAAADQDRGWMNNNMMLYYMLLLSLHYHYTVFTSVTVEIVLMATVRFRMTTGRIQIGCERNYSCSAYLCFLNKIKFHETA